MIGPLEPAAPIVLFKPQDRYPAGIHDRQSSRYFSEPISNTFPVVEDGSSPIGKISLCDFGAQFIGPEFDE